MKKHRVGIIGATGTVGQRLLSLLNGHPWFVVTELGASSNSKGKTYEEAVVERWIFNSQIPENVRDIVLKDAVKDAEVIAKNVDFVFCAINLPKEETIELEEMYAKLECPVVSNNSANRLNADVPLILPEINPQHLDIIPVQKRRLGTKRGFIAAKPNCSLQSYVPALFPILEFGVTEVLVCTYQAISGAGKTFETFPEMVDNIIPYIEGEEEKSEFEPLKIFGTIKNSKIVNASGPIFSAQCTRVPITDGHTACIFAKLNRDVSLEQIIEKWKNYENPIAKFSLPSAPNNFLTYYDEKDRPQIKLDRDLENGMGIAIGRLRKDSLGNIKFVSTSHNTIRGAAGGAILLAELLCAKDYI